MSIRVSEARTAAGRHYPLSRIGPFVRDLRTSRGQPQWKVAQQWAQLGVEIRDTQSVVSEVETSKRIPAEDLLLVIAQWADGAPMYTPPSGPALTVTLGVLIEWREQDLADRAIWVTEGRRRGAKRAGASRTARVKKRKALAEARRDEFLKAREAEGLNWARKAAAKTAAGAAEAMRQSVAQHMGLGGIEPDPRPEPDPVVPSDVPDPVVPSAQPNGAPILDLTDAKIAIGIADQLALLDEDRRRRVLLWVIRVLEVGL